MKKGIHISNESNLRYRREEIFYAYFIEKIRALSGFFALPSFTDFLFSNLLLAPMSIMSKNLHTY